MREALFVYYATTKTQRGTLGDTKIPTSTPFVPSESCRPFPPQNHALPQRDMGQKQNSSTDDVMESKSKDLDSKSQSILREGMDYSCQKCEIFTFACQNKILTLLFMLPYHPPYSS